MHILTAGFGALLLVAKVTADCGCGYSVNSTTSPVHAVFTEKIESNFINGTDITWDSEPGINWQAQEYNMSSEAARGPDGKLAALQNVVLNKLPCNSSGAEGVEGGDAGLQLWVRSQLVKQDGSAYVSIAEIVSARDDILYGSFRVSLRTTRVNGTCGAFFFYHNDSQEIDAEFLSRQLQGQQNVVNLVNQSPQSDSAGFNAANTSSFLQVPTVVDPDQSYNEWRFDWLSNRVDFYVNGFRLATLYDNVPNTPGQIHLSHWSNGDPNWSGGPPSKDAVLTISYINAYFNGTNSTESSTCNDGSDVCLIADQQPSQPNTPGSEPSETPKPMHSGARQTRDLGAFRVGLVAFTVITTAAFFQRLPNAHR